tara:strand:- start:64 stop:444 length:381 start_codon:yes stop_codon:yes gene_type:complete
MATKNITFVPSTGVPNGANFNIYSGADFQADLVVYSTTNAKFDLTDYTGAAALSKSIAVGATLGATASFTVGFTSAYDGKVRLSLTDSQTSNLTEGRYVYNFNITKSGFTYPLIAGNINVINTVTS